jgi:hypothetical protein
MYIRGSAVNVRMYLPAPLWTPRAAPGGLLLCWCRLPQRGAIVESHSHGEGPVVFRIGSAAAAGCGELQSSSLLHYLSELHKFIIVSA